MEDKKAKFIVYICIALIAFICSSAVYSMTGGLSDWIVSSDYDEDKNNNGYLDSSENGGGLFSLFGSDENNYNSYDNGDSDWSELINKGLDKLSNPDDSYSSSSSDEPDFLARLLRFFISNG
ncbi:hypothetical protein [Methanobrevibacter sp.]|uniref:hypothetical protein n=1 Tax=Methanobrevibacter sp. TaxID=66852 RepID=UPI0025D9AAB4|nr:hypothetical protein [Methanobrevibacter sp.]MBQ2961346.1 hypothetical protein [Methanobrevibacter sp.]